MLKKGGLKMEKIKYKTRGVWTNFLTRELFVVLLAAGSLVFNIIVIIGH
jgi:hypothetical protein